MVDFQYNVRNWIYSKWSPYTNLSVLCVVYSHAEPNRKTTSEIYLDGNEKGRIEMSI